MKTIKRLFALCLLLSIITMVMISPHADTIVTVDGYSYIETSYGLGSLVGWDNRSDTLYVPAKIGNVYCSEIADSAFTNDDYIKKLNVTDATRLYRIGMFAFSNSVLEGDLYIPSRVTNVGISAFERTNIESVLYDSGSGVVSAQCFQYCTNLKSVSLTSFITTIDRYAFRGCVNLSSITIPETVISINSTAFYNCENLTIHCYPDSYAQSFAEDNGIEYILIDAPTPTEPVTEPATEVVTEPATQEPTSATEPSTDPTEPKAPYMLGDADNSGDIDVIDATFVQRYSIEAFIPCEDTIMQADIDSSGDVSSIDATFILRHLIHISVGYPIGEYVS